MKGFFGKVLNIDCTRQSNSDEAIEDAVYEKYICGKGLASYLLLKKNPEGVDPLSPTNHLILATGPANGFPIWGAIKYVAYTKSPLTGVYSESYSGGKAFLPIAKTGYDAISLRGALEKWSYLEVSNDSVLFKDANFLVGKDSFETEKILKEKYHGKKSAVLTIGPAGENLVKFAYVNNDFGRSLGRTGIGAVMGSKRIKAIVFMGDQNKEAADRALLKDFWNKQLKARLELPVF